MERPVTPLGSEWKTDFAHVPDTVKGSPTTLLGRGAYGNVYLVTYTGETSEEEHLYNGHNYALKVVNHRKVKKNDGAIGVEGLEIEIAILNYIDHPQLLSMHAYYHDAKYEYLITDVVRGGELFSRVSKLDHYTEKTAKSIVSKILDGIAYIHRRGIVHRDLKPANILLKRDGQDKDFEGDIVLCDFGFSYMLEQSDVDWTFDDKSLRDNCGTVGYKAPELCVPDLMKSRPSKKNPNRLRYYPTYGRPSDIYALGVIVFQMLFGDYPFKHKNDEELERILVSMMKTRATKEDFTVHFPSYVEEDLSKCCKDFVSKLLTFDPDERPTVFQLQQHPWITESIHTESHLVSSQKHLRNFLARRRLKKGINTVRATIRMSKAFGKFSSGSFKKATSSPTDSNRSTASADDEKETSLRSRISTGAKSVPEITEVDETETDNASKEKSGLELKKDSSVATDAITLQMK